MSVHVKISENDNLEVWRLFHKYHALLDILAYMNANSSYSDFMDKKVDEATQLYMELEAAKSKCKVKYAPNSCYKTYVFDFENQELIFEE